MAPSLRFHAHDSNNINNTIKKNTNTNNYTNGRTTRPTSDPMPETSTVKKAKTPFASLGFGKGGSISNALGVSTSGGGTKTRKGLRGLFGHKKESSASSGDSSPTRSDSSAGNSSSPRTPSASVFPPAAFTVNSRKALPALPESPTRGSFGRALWGRITGGGSVKMAQAPESEVVGERPNWGPEAHVFPPCDVPVTAKSLSHAPPFPPFRSSEDSPRKTTRNRPYGYNPTPCRARLGSLENQQANASYRLQLMGMFDVPGRDPDNPDQTHDERVCEIGSPAYFKFEKESRAREKAKEEKSKSMRPPPSTGSLARPPLGNMFLGPLPGAQASVEHEDEPSLVSRVTSMRMSVAAKPEMAEQGYETVVASGVDTVRRRGERSGSARTRTAPLSIGSEESDMASSVSAEYHLASIGIVNRANKTLHELVARLELASPTASPASSPAKTVRSNANMSQQSIVSEATSMFPSPSPMGRVRAPLAALHRPASAKRIKPKSRLSTAPEVATPAPEPEAEPEQVPEVPARSPSRSTFGHVEGLNDQVSSDDESELPDDLIVILTDAERLTIFGPCSVESASSPPSPPAVVADSLPAPPPTNRISPRRAQLQVNLPVPQTFGTYVQSRSSQPAGSDDASSDGGMLSPGCRDSSTFDFTGEIGKLNANIRASFVDQLHGDAPPVSGRQAKSRRSKSADETGTDAFPAIQQGHLRTSSSPQVKGVIRSDFKFGSPLPSITAAARSAPAPIPQAPSALPTFAIRAPTPCSPQRATFLPETSFMNLDSPSTASDASDMDVEMDDAEFDTRRFSIVSDNSSKQRERRAGQTHRRTGHNTVQSSATSFASMSSLGQIISGGSPDPFSFDFPSKRSMQMDQDASLSLSYEERSRMDSTFSAVTQSSLGVLVKGTHGVTDPFNFSSMRIGESCSTTYTRHNRTFSAESGVSNFSFHDPNSSGNSGSFGRKSHHRRQSSIASIHAVGGTLPPLGPPVSMFNKPRGYKASNVSLRSQRSTIGRPDWAKHRRQQSSMDSQASGRGGRFERPNVGERMFSPDQGVQLFSITASPNGSTDESFDSQQQAATHVVHRIIEERSESSDSGMEDHCRTSFEDSAFDNVAVRQHGQQSSNGSDSIFHSTDESYNRSLSFAIKPLRPISGVSVNSSSSDIEEPNEDDTFAFKRQTAAPSPRIRVPLSPRDQQRLRCNSSSARPMSVVSNTSSVFFGANDTFAVTRHRAAPLPFSLPKLDHSKQTAAPVAVRAGGVSPLRIKRKAVPKADASVESPRKARLLDGSEVERSSAETLKSFRMPTQGMKERPSLEESCLTGEGEDLFFSSQEPSMSDANPLGSITNTNLSASTASTRRSTASSRPRAPSRNKASSNKSRPSTMVFSPAPPDTPPMTSPSASESSYPQSNQSSLDLSLLMNSLAAASVDTATQGVTTRARARRADMVHRRRTSGAKGPVMVPLTIHEERSVPSLSGSSPPSTGNSLESSFPSPMFLRGREPDIAAYDDDPEAIDAMRGWREFDREARYEQGKSQAKWLDTEYSAAMMANFHPPTKAAEVKAFVIHSKTTFVALSSPSKSSLLIHRRSSSLTESRIGASPYFAPPALISIPLKTKLRSKRPSHLPTKFGGSSPLLANFPPAPPSAKFAQFARERPVTPPPTLLDVDIPNDALRGPWDADAVEEPKQPSSSSVKKAKRVSEEVRRSKLGWIRRKTDDANGAVATGHGTASVKEVVLDKAQASKGKRTSLIYQDAPSRIPQLGLPHAASKPNNKENFYAHPNGAIKPLITRPNTRSSLVPRPIRA